MDHSRLVTVHKSKNVQLYFTREKKERYASFSKLNHPTFHSKDAILQTLIQYK